MRWPNLGFRREVVVIFLVTTLLLVLLLTVTILSFHTALGRLVEERRLEAASLASKLADQVSARGLPTASELRLAAPGVIAAAVIDSTGRTLAVEGSFEGTAPTVAPMIQELSGPVGLGPNSFFPDRVAGIAPVRRGQQMLLVRIDLSAQGLAHQQETLRVLTWVAGTAGLAIPILVLFFLRHFLSPYERLLKQARLVGDATDSDDEMSFLVSTVEKALGSMSASTVTAGEDDILALERTLGPSLQSGVLILDPAGRALALNDIGSTLLDVELPEQGAPFDRLLASHPALRDALGQVVEEQTQVRRKEVAVHGLAGPLTLGLTVHVLKRDDDSVRGYLALFIDLTEIQRRNEEEKLSKSLAQLGELTAGVAHELRNSLGSLKGYLSLIDRRGGEDRLEDYLAEIHRETDNLQRVLDDFLSFARPGTAQLETLDVATFLQQVCEDPGLGGKAVNIAGGPSIKGSVIRGDSQLLERALRNLLQNACQAELESGHEGPLEVTVNEDPEGLEISILDRGPGLAAEMRDRLFEPFATHRPEGVGLGLALARRIVDLHGGRLSLEDRPDGGAVARLTLPAQALDPSEGS